MPLPQDTGEVIAARVRTASGVDVGEKNYKVLGCDANGNLLVAFASGASLPITPSIVSQNLINKLTATVGTNYTAFDPQACNWVSLVNGTGVDLEVRYVGSLPTLIIPAGAGYRFGAVTNANQLEFRRQDQSNTQVTVRAQALTL